MIGTSFLAGFACAAFAAASIYFLKFWRASNDRFFLYFGIACGLLALERPLLIYIVAPNLSADRPPEAHAWVYVVRMLVYSIILFAVVQRNRGEHRR